MRPEGNQDGTACYKRPEHSEPVGAPPAGAEPQKPCIRAPLELREAHLSHLQALTAAKQLSQGRGESVLLARAKDEMQAHLVGEIGRRHMSPVPWAKRSTCS